LTELFQGKLRIVEVLLLISFITNQDQSNFITVWIEMLARGLDFLRLDEYSRIPLSLTVATLDGWVGDSSFAVHDVLFLANAKTGAM